MGKCFTTLHIHPTLSRSIVPTAVTNYGPYSLHSLSLPQAKLSGNAKLIRRQWGTRCFMTMTHRNDYFQLLLSDTM
jgi:hypothetical protein